MKRYIALLIISVLLLSMRSECESALSPQSAAPELLYPACEDMVLGVSDHSAMLCSEFLDSYESEILEIYDLFLTWQDTYYDVQYRQFVDWKDWYNINGEESNSWEELPFREELFAFRDRFQCTKIDWECNTWWCDCGPTLDLVMPVAKNQHGYYQPRLLYIPVGIVEHHIPGPGMYTPIPGHTGWYEYVIFQE